MLLDALLDRRLVLVTGKGGVGKSAVAAAMALVASERGRRTLLVEVDAPIAATRYLDAEAAGPREREALPGLFAVNLRPTDVMDEYVERVVRVGALARRIVESPVYERFYAAAPGLKELMVLGKIVALSQEREAFARRPRFDVVIAELPATGHGLSMLKVPMRASAAIPVGPVGNKARQVLEALRDPARSALVVVAVPEEMAVTEAIEFHRSAASEVGIEPGAVVLNACHERRFTDAQEATILRLISTTGDERSGALSSARRHLRRRKLTHFYETKLRRALPGPLVSLPFLYEGEIRLAALRQLAERLAEA